MRISQLLPLLACSVPLLQASCACPYFSAVDDQDERPWVMLFDGETTEGWTSYNQDTLSEGWQVVDGALTMVGNGGDIVTMDMYADFELELEWNLAAGGNSGILYNVIDGESAVYISGPEMQLLDNSAHSDGANNLTSVGSCYGLYMASRDASNPPGSWNKARLVNQEGHVQHWLNGELLCEYTLGSDDWNARVAGSKFKAWAPFGLARKGRIAFQDHGARVAFRNIRIR
ncbi:MAG: hypothetical protein ACI9F9_002773 [Candidatus Paceibacteria bacterium]|jgi:hypothetical protein